MYKSLVMEGRLLEVHNDHAVTVQGDMISTYHRRYYMFPEEDITFEVSADLEEQDVRDGEMIGLRSKESHFRWPNLAWLPIFNKGANRV